MTAPKFPPRVWISNSSPKSWGGGAQYVFSYREKLHKDDIEFLSLEECEALMREARAEGIEKGITIWTTPSIAFGNKSPLDLLKEGIEPEFILGTFYRIGFLSKEEREGK